jgi:hypothetical protein
MHIAPVSLPNLDASNPLGRATKTVRKGLSAFLEALLTIINGLLVN